MPAKGSTGKNKPVSVAFKKTTPKRKSTPKPLLRKQRTISRIKALKKVSQSLMQQHCQISEDIIGLIALFRFRPEELTEAGVPYEMVRALEKAYPLLLDD